jgi:hypothetical protein
MGSLSQPFMSIIPLALSLQHIVIKDGSPDFPVFAYQSTVHTRTVQRRCYYLANQPMSHHLGMSLTIASIVEGDYTSYTAVSAQRFDDRLRSFMHWLAEVLHPACHRRRSVLADEVLATKKKKEKASISAALDPSLIGSGKQRTSPSPVPLTPTARTFPHHGRGNHRRHRGSCHSSTQKPAPLWGVSPMRPGSLFVRPPVDVHAAMHPRTSSATAPTVPIGIISSNRSSSLPTSPSSPPSPFPGGSSSGSPSPRRCSRHRAGV